MFMGLLNINLSFKEDVNVCRLVVMGLIDNNLSIKERCPCLWWLWTY